LSPTAQSVARSVTPERVTLVDVDVVRPHSQAVPLPV
jgi:hypothetical protein